MSIFPYWYICVFGADDFQMNRGASLFYKKKKKKKKKKKTFCYAS